VSKGLGKVEKGILLVLGEAGAEEDAYDRKWHQRKRYIAAEYKRRHFNEDWKTYRRKSHWSKGNPDYHGRYVANGRLAVSVSRAIKSLTAKGYIEDCWRYVY